MRFPLPPIIELCPVCTELISFSEPPITADRMAWVLLLAPPIDNEASPIAELPEPKANDPTPDAMLECPATKEFAPLATLSCPKEKLLSPILSPQTVLLAVPIFK